MTLPFSQRNVITPSTKLGFVARLRIACDCAACAPLEGGGRFSGTIFQGQGDFATSAADAHSHLGLAHGAAKSDRPVPPLDSLVVSGDDAAIAARFNELLETGLDELLVMAVPVAHPQGEQARLARLIGQL